MRRELPRGAVQPAHGREVPREAVQAARGAGVAPAAVQPALPPLQPPEQQRYARVLEGGVRIGLGLLVLVFAGYAFELTDPLVPHSRVAEVWNLPVSAFLAETGLPQGWGWLGHAHRGDIANMVGIAMLSGCSVLALLSLVPLYWRRGERLYAALCLAEVGVIGVAASGVLTAGA